MWTAIPPQKPDLSAKPRATLLTYGDTLVVGEIGGCGATYVPLPLDGEITVALQPIDLAGNAGITRETTFALRPTHATMDPPSGATVAPEAQGPAVASTPAVPATRGAIGAGRSLMLALAVRIGLGILAAAITLRLPARRARPAR